MKAIWALEPFNQDQKGIRTLSRWIRQLAPKGKTEAVFVASPASSQLNTAYEVPREKRYTEYPRKLLVQTLEKALGKSASPTVKILTEGNPSLTAQADRLVSYAEKEKASFIAVMSRSSSGLKRLFLGSFAETLIHRSTLPVLLMNPAVGKPPPLKRIYFADDFGPRSDSSWRKVLDLAKGSEAEIVLFHMENPAYRFAYDEGDPEYEREKGRLERRLVRRAREARDRGLLFKHRVDSSFSDGASTILSAAQKDKADLLVMVARTGRWEAMMGGSITRKVARAARLPVLILKA